MTTRIEIDLNVRVRGNGSYAGFEDVQGPLSVGADVEVYESESGLTGCGHVTQIDTGNKLVYLSVDWASMHEAEPEAVTVAGLAPASVCTSNGFRMVESLLGRLLGQPSRPASYHPATAMVYCAGANAGLAQPRIGGYESPAPMLASAEVRQWA